MKNKKLYLSGLIVLFALVIIALLFVTFSIKDIKTEYSVSERQIDVTKLEEKIKEFKGKNLVFFNQEEIENVVAEFPYFEVESVEKSFPSTLSIKLKERQQVYSVKVEGKFAVLDNNGIVIDLLESKKEGLIEINLDSPSNDGQAEFFSDCIKVENCRVGSKIITNFDDYFYKSINIISSNESSDIFKEMKIYINDTLKTFDIVLSTKTKINIRINEVQDLGKEKLDFAINEYNNQTSDFKKSNEMYNMTIRTKGNNEIFVKYEIEG